MKKKLFIVSLFLVVLLVISYQNKSYILAKGYQLTPNLMDKLRFYYFNFQSTTGNKNSQFFYSHLFIHILKQKSLGDSPRANVKFMLSL